jgi:hypothetical protein
MQLGFFSHEFSRYVDFEDGDGHADTVERLLLLLLLLSLMLLLRILTVRYRDIAQNFRLFYALRFYYNHVTFLNYNEVLITLAFINDFTPLAR